MARGHSGELLSALLDGQLSDRRRREVEAHLSRCARCRGGSGSSLRSKPWSPTFPSAPPRPAGPGASSSRGRWFPARPALGAPRSWPGRWP
ncbi:MAG: zf-HC2 domain-containing protein [Actinomycetota bacterium]